MVAATTETKVLEARNVSKTFGGIKALDGVDLDVYAGQVGAVVGENGAGKSTLMNILSGVYQGYGGQIVLDGQQVVFANPKDAQDKERGLAADILLEDLEETKQVMRTRISEFVLTDEGKALFLQKGQWFFIGIVSSPLEFPNMS